MTMRYRPNVAISQTGTNQTLQYLFEFLDFMRTAPPDGPGWTIPRSSDGTTGGDGDHIASWSDLGQYVDNVSESWFVLRDPAAGRELLWWRTNSNDAYWNCYESPSAGFTGGDEGHEPTATDTVGIHWSVQISSVPAGTPSMLHMAADDAAPYGWYAWLHLAGNFATTSGGYMMIPMDAHQAAGDTDPVVFYANMDDNGFSTTYLSRDDVGLASGMCRGIVPGTTSMQTIPALWMDNGGSLFVPRYVRQDANFADLAFPIVFSRQASLATPGYKGVTTFVRWEGVNRASGEVWADKSRICVADLSLPWDGVTVPRHTA
jgi:hypothetical protein